MEQASTKDRNECLLLIEAHGDESTKILDELGSATEERFQVERVTKLSDGIERLGRGGIWAVVLELALPDSHGVETFEKLMQAAPHVPILVLAGTDTEDIGKEAVRRGAEDYLIKNQADGYRLSRAVRAISDRRAAKTISLENHAANVALNAIGEAVLCTDIRADVTYLNRIAEKLTGWKREEAFGRPVAEVLQLIDGVTRTPIDNAVEIVIQGDKTAITPKSCNNCILVRRDGSEFGIENTMALIYDEDGGANGAVVAFHDVSAARARSLELSHLAQHDALTDLPNRSLFNDRLAQALALAERQHKQLAVMFVDLDAFKKVNDSLGHDVGDKLLQSIASRLLGCVRRSDTVGRLGGDEFVVLLSQLEREEDAPLTARKILRMLSAPHTIDSKSIDLSVSIGGSTFPSDGRDAENLLNKADTAMYEAKQHGGNSYQFYRPDMHARLTERRSLEADLRYALGRNEFLLHYQPKFNLQSGQITGMEALIRWLHPQRGMVYPLEFMPIAEECGLILSIGRWVLLEACRQAREWRDAGLGVIPVAVNVSASEFVAKDFLSGVRAALIATGVEPSNLELELTESVLMLDAEAAVVTLKALKAMGIQLAIDDFGTGYSSFTYLRRFRVDALKVHQSFVHDIMRDPGDETLVSAMINLGRSLNQRVIAEGVETLEQLNFLQRHGCSEGQGYYFSRPVAAEKAEKLFEAGIRAGVIH